MSAILALTFVTSHCFAAYTTRLACSHKIDADDHQANGSQKGNGFKTAKNIGELGNISVSTKRKIEPPIMSQPGFHSRNDHRSLELGWGLVWGKFAQSTPGPQLPQTLRPTIYEEESQADGLPTQEVTLLQPLDN
jgi:hypothetical protein